MELLNNIIGQPHIKNLLKVLLPEIKKDYKCNLLITGRSGLGKSYLTKAIYNYLGVENTIKYIPDQWVNFRGDKKYHVIDEIHAIKNFERLLIELDKKDKVVIMTTNFRSLLPEALINRSIELQLSDYTLEELTLITYQNLNIKSLDIARIIAKKSRDLPRNCKLLAERVNLLGRNIDHEKVVAFLNSIGIYQGGLTNQDFRYLEIVRKARYISKRNLINILGKETVEFSEPFLLKRGFIQITNKGRKYAL